MAELNPEVWSDFDGTAVEKLRVKDPRHWKRNIRKYPLAGMERYADFLRGVQSKDVDIAGVVSRRGERMERLRRSVTTRSISDLGLEEFFGPPARVVLTGGEDAKGRFIGERSLVVPVGMLEDQPQKHVAELVAYGVGARAQDDTPHHHPILVGVVDHPSSQDRIEGLKLDMEHTPYERVTVREEIGTNTGLIIYAAPLTIHVTQLEPYSEAGGQDFAQRLIELAP